MPIRWTLSANADACAGRCTASRGSSTPAAAAGCPNVTVPMGFVAGLPVGVSFIGEAWSEETLIRLAYAFEQARQHRRAPRYAATVGR